MKNYINSAGRVVVVATAAVSSGSGVLLNALFGVAAGDAEIGDDLVLDIVGGFDLKAKAGDTAAVGEYAYWDAAAKVVTTTATDNVKVGVFLKVKTADATVAAIRLNGSF